MEFNCWLSCMSVLYQALEKQLNQACMSECRSNALSASTQLYVCVFVATKDCKKDMNELHRSSRLTLDTL